MSPTPKQLPKHILRYSLAPSAEARAALDETFAAYHRMLAILDDLLAEEPSANLVLLHERAYETVRERTGLPARLVTLGLRDFATNRAAVSSERIPLDEKLYSIKGPSDLTVATLRGRVTIPFDVEGYSQGWDSIFPAYLTAADGAYEIHIGVTRNSPRLEDSMMNEGILSRMGRLIAGAANAAIDKAEGANKVVVIEQAIREIDAAADEARADLGKAKAEEYRISSRRREIAEDINSLDGKIRNAISESREDLAKAGVARQIDLEAQIAALDKALLDAREHMQEGQKALQAVLATRREAEARLADYKRSLTASPEYREIAKRADPTAQADRASAAVSRMTGVPASELAGSAELDELDRLHRETAIEARLARFKGDSK